jgi:aldehyde:ferredoxin oxidoreductase
MWRVEVWELMPWGWDGDSTSDEYLEDKERAIARAVALIGEYSERGVRIAVTVADPNGLAVWRGGSRVETASMN